MSTRYRPEEAGAEEYPWPVNPSKNKLLPYLVVQMRRVLEEDTVTVTASSTTTVSVSASTWSGVLAYATEFKHYASTGGNYVADIGGDLGTTFSVVTGTGAVEPFYSYYRTVSTDHRSYVPGTGVHYYERTPDSMCPPIYTFEMLAKVQLPLQPSNGLTGSFWSAAANSTNAGHGFGWIQTDERESRVKYVAWVSARNGALGVPLETSYTYADGASFDYPYDTFQHFVVERCRHKWSYFVNGNRVLTMTQSASASYTWHGALSILYGYLTNYETTASNSLMTGISPLGAWKGFVDSIRVTCDETVYGDVNSFTPPTRLLDKCKYLLHFDDTMSAVQTPNNTMYYLGWYSSAANYYHISASESAYVSTALAKFGTGSLRCKGGYFTTPSRYGTMIGKSRFSIDFWIYPESTLSASSYIFDSRGNGQAGDTLKESIAIHGLTSGGMALKWRDNASFASTTDAIAINTWSHVAVDMDSANYVTLYINGNVIGGTTVTTSLAAAGFNKLFLGGSNLVSGARYLGYIDEFRFMLHTACWGGVAFTPPTSAYPNRYLPR